MSDKRWSTSTLICAAVGTFIGCQIAHYTRKAPAPASQAVRIEAERIELSGKVYLAGPVQLPPITLPPYPPSPPVLVYPEVVIDDLPDAIKDRLMSPHQVSVTANPPKVEIVWPERMIFELAEPRAELESKFGKVTAPPADASPAPAPAFRAELPPVQTTENGPGPDNTGARPSNGPKGPTAQR